MDETKKRNRTKFEGLRIEEGIFYAFTFRADFCV